MFNEINDLIQTDDNRLRLQVRSANRVKVETEQQRRENRSKSVIKIVINNSRPGSATIIECTAQLIDKASIAQLTA